MSFCALNVTFTQQAIIRIYITVCPNFKKSLCWMPRIDVKANFLAINFGLYINTQPMCLEKINTAVYRS